MAKEIQLPDGSIAEFPDEMPDDQIQQVLQQQFRDRRAEGEAGTGVVPSPRATVSPELPDPFEGAPTEIGGVKLDDEMRSAIQAARQVKNPKERRLLTARIAGRLAADDEQGGNIADQITNSGFGAAIRGFGAGLFGLGDVAAAAGTALEGIGDENAMSFGEALEAQREFRRALEEDFPLTSGLSEIAGAVTGGGGAGLAARGAFKAGTQGRRVLDAATRLQRGQRGRNILRAAALGAGAGAVTEGVTEGDPSGGAAVGAVGGPLGLGIVKAGQVTSGAVKELLKSPAGKSIDALAKKIGQAPDEISRRFLEFKEATGRNPALADLANDQAVAELRDMIAARTGAEAIVGEAAEQAVRRRAGEFGEDVAGDLVTTTQGAQKQARDRVARQQFALVADQDFTFGPDEVKDLLLDADLRRAMPPTLKRRVNEILDEAGEDAPVTLKGQDVNDLRLALRDRAKGATGADRVFGELADEVEFIARDQSPEFGRAIDEFAKRSRRGEAVAAGRKSITQPTSEFRQVASEAPTGNELAGLRVGARSALADVAGESPSRAASVAESLSQDSGLVRRLQEVLEPREVQRLQRLGRASARSFRNIEQLSPRAKAQAEEGLRELVNTAADAIVAVSPTTSAASKVFSISRGLRRLLPGGVPDRVVEQMARDIFDPAKTAQVITAMRRAEVPEEQILDLFIIAGTGGQQAASRTGED